MDDFDLHLAAEAAGALSGALIVESAPMAPGAEDWIKSNKKRFQDRYGADWERVIYAKAWKLFGKNAANATPAHLRECGELLFEDNGQTVVVTVAGPTASGKSALVRGIHQFLNQRGHAAVVDSESEAADAEDSCADDLPANTVIKVQYESAEESEALTEAAWWDKYVRRPLTEEESGQLKVPKAELGCTVQHFSDKKGKALGFRAYTHRACSEFYPTPGAIPKKTLEFISSTG